MPSVLVTLMFLSAAGVVYGGPKKAPPDLPAKEERVRQLQEQLRRVQQEYEELTNGMENETGAHQQGTAAAAASNHWVGTSSSSSLGAAAAAAPGAAAANPGGGGRPG
eukprot:9494464-Pyramimonas_sp.AAC.1